jgi:hypothetical protein
MRQAPRRPPVAQGRLGSDEAAQQGDEADEAW